MNPTMKKGNMNTVTRDSKIDVVAACFVAITLAVTYMALVIASTCTLNASGL